MHVWDLKSTRQCFFYFWTYKSIELSSNWIGCSASRWFFRMNWAGNRHSQLATSVSLYALLDLPAIAKLYLDRCSSERPVDGMDPITSEQRFTQFVALSLFH